MHISNYSKNMKFIKNNNQLRNCPKVSNLCKEKEFLRNNKMKIIINLNLNYFQILIINMGIQLIIPIPHKMWK